jgi:hypothetical protein
VLITDLPGGEDFAFHQKSKTGDVPRVLPLDHLQTQGYLVVLTWGWKHQMDMRWSPGLMQHDGRRFLYASGYQTPNRTVRVGRTRGPSTRVIDLPWIGELHERVYAVDPNAEYFVLLPQNSSVTPGAYSLQMRSRSNGVEQPVLLLLAGLACIFGGGAWLCLRRRASFSFNLPLPADVVPAARAYAQQKRYARAHRLLTQAVDREPHRRTEFEALMRDISVQESMSKNRR